MSLADDMEPGDCLEVCQETMAEALLKMTAHLPGPDDAPDELAKKYTILGSTLRTIKTYTAEALKATQHGSDSVAFLLSEQAKHKPLSEFGDTEIKITGPDGMTVNTTLEKIEQAADKLREADQ